jgi:hypothetical protein
MLKAASYYQSGEVKAFIDQVYGGLLEVFLIMVTTFMKTLQLSGEKKMSCHPFSGHNFEISSDKLRVGC